MQRQVKLKETDGSSFYQGLLLVSLLISVAVSGKLRMYPEVKEGI